MVSAASKRRALRSFAVVGGLAFELGVDGGEHSRMRSVGPRIVTVAVPSSSTSNDQVRFVVVALVDDRGRCCADLAASGGDGVEL